MNRSVAGAKHFKFRWHPEILRLIFESCLSPIVAPLMQREPDYPDPITQLSSVLLTCKHWYQFALSTPSLWATLHSEWDELTPVLLRRSVGAELTVQWAIDSRANGLTRKWNFLLDILDHAARIADFTIVFCLKPGTPSSLGDYIDELFTLLQSDAFRPRSIAVKCIGGIIPLIPPRFIADRSRCQEFILSFCSLKALEGDFPSIVNLELRFWAFNLMYNAFRGLGPATPPHLPSVQGLFNIFSGMPNLTRLTYASGYYTIDGALSLTELLRLEQETLPLPQLKELTCTLLPIDPMCAVIRHFRFHPTCSVQLQFFYSYRDIGDPDVFSRLMEYIFPRPLEDLRPSRIKWIGVMGDQRIFLNDLAGPIGSLDAAVTREVLDNEKVISKWEHDAYPFLGLKRLFSNDSSLNLDVTHLTLSFHFLDPFVKHLGESSETENTTRLPWAKLRSLTLTATEDFRGRALKFDDAAVERTLLKLGGLLAIRRQMGRGLDAVHIKFVLQCWNSSLDAPSLIKIGEAVPNLEVVIYNAADPAAWWEIEKEVPRNAAQ